MPISSLVTLTAIQWSIGSTSTGDLCLFVCLFIYFLSFCLIQSFSPSCYFNNFKFLKQREFNLKTDNTIKQWWVCVGATPGNPSARTDNAVSRPSSQGTFKTHPLSSRTQKTTKIIQKLGPKIVCFFKNQLDVQKQSYCVYFFCHFFVFCYKKIFKQVYCSSYIYYFHHHHHYYYYYLYFYFLYLSVRLYASAATGSRVKKRGFFFSLNGI